MKTLRYIVCLVVIASQSVALPQVPTFHVKAFGAKGDGTTLDSPAIQRVIDTAAASATKAKVIVDPGKYLIGTIELKSGIELYLHPKQL